MNLMGWRVGGHETHNCINSLFISTVIFCLNTEQTHTPNWRESQISGAHTPVCGTSPGEVQLSLCHQTGNHRQLEGPHTQNQLACETEKETSGVEGYHNWVEQETLWQFSEHESVVCNRLVTRNLNQSSMCDCLGEQIFLS